jgi:hypothetical protein
MEVGLKILERKHAQQFLSTGPTEAVPEFVIL